MSHGAMATSPVGGTRTPADGGLNAGYTRTIPGLLKMGQIVSLHITAYTGPGPV